MKQLSFAAVKMKYVFCETGRVKKKKWKKKTRKEQTISAVSWGVWVLFSVAVKKYMCVHDSHMFEIGKKKRWARGEN